MSQNLTELLLAAQQGDQAAWGRLLHGLRRFVVVWVRAFERRANPEEQEDRVQACYEWLHRYRQDVIRPFDPTRGSVLAWIQPICHRALLNHKRAQAAKARRLVEATDSEVLEALAEDAPPSPWALSPTPDAERQVMQNAEFGGIVKFVEGRDELDRHVFWGHLANGMEQTELAACLGMPADRIAQRKLRLVKALRGAFPDIVLATGAALLLSGLLFN